MAVMLDGRFCMKIDFISQWREIVLFLPSNMAAMQTLYKRKNIVPFHVCLLFSSLSVTLRVFIL